APLTPATRHMIDASVFARMKPTAHLVNISRGGLIDQEALLMALDEGRIARATLDVTTPEPLPEGHPLYAHPKVRVSPHISFSGGPPRNIPIFLNNLRRYIAGEPLEGLVQPGEGY